MARCTVSLKVVHLCKGRWIYADMSVFAHMNTLRGSCSTCRSPENNFWNVDILLHHLHKQLQLVKRPISPGQHCPIKTCRAKCPHECAWGSRKRRESKVAQFAFPLQGKEKQTCGSISEDEERHAARAEATMDPELNGYESMWKDLTLSRHRAHCAKEEVNTTSLHRGQSQQRSPDTSLAWHSTGLPSQTTAPLMSELKKDIIPQHHGQGKDMHVKIKWWFRSHFRWAVINSTTLTILILKLLPCCRNTTLDAILLFTFWHHLKTRTCFYSFMPNNHF